MSEEQSITIREGVIELGQFLKLARIVGTGGQAKWLLADEKVRVNGEIETRRGRKLQVGDWVEVEDIGVFRLQESKTE